jgi:F0F1-type ATP synthase membrane subunit c/vacuolar-type H+-ATPase subunit K
MKWIAGLLALAILGCGCLLGMTGFATFEPAAKDITDRGVARVTDCTSRGPVSLSGFGTWWICRADVEWESGTRTRVTAEADQLTPDDKGTEVPVVQRGESKVRNGSGNPPVYRAGFEPSILLGLGSLLGGMGVGAIGALAVLGSVASRRKKAQERE